MAKWKSVVLAEWKHHRNEIQRKLKNVNKSNKIRTKSRNLHFCAKVLRTRIEQYEEQIAAAATRERVAKHREKPWYRRMFSDPYDYYDYDTSSRISIHRDVSNLFRELQDLRDGTFTVSSHLSIWID